MHESDYIYWVLSACVAALVAVLFVVEPIYTNYSSWHRKKKMLEREKRDKLLVQRERMKWTDS